MSKKTRKPVVSVTPTAPKVALAVEVVQTVTDVFTLKNASNYGYATGIHKDGRIERVLCIDYVAPWETESSAKVRIAKRLYPKLTDPTAFLQNIALRPTVKDFKKPANIWI